MLDMNSLDLPGNFWSDGHNMAIQESIIRRFSGKAPNEVTQAKEKKRRQNNDATGPEKNPPHLPTLNNC
jgi:hypothetical protein